MFDLILLGPEPQHIREVSGLLPALVGTWLWRPRTLPSVLFPFIGVREVGGLPEIL